MLGTGEGMHMTSPSPGDGTHISGRRRSMWIFKVGVVGAGTMGGGIAQVVSFSGLPVVVKDIDEKQLDLARNHVEGIYQSRIDKGKMTAGQVQEKLSLIEYSLDYSGFSDVDIVIEAVP
ncbi:MAG: hypothetical protein EHM41_24575, partial [Chloroflexi bacterium]